MSFIYRQNVEDAIGDCAAKSWKCAESYNYASKSTNNADKSKVMLQRRISLPKKIANLIVKSATSCMDAIYDIYVHYTCDLPRYGPEGSRPKTGKKDSDNEEEEDFKVSDII